VHPPTLHRRRGRFGYDPTRPIRPEATPPVVARKEKALRFRSFYVRRLRGYLLQGLGSNAWPILRASWSFRHRQRLGDREGSDLSGPGQTSRNWWEGAGLGLMYQIEARPGWRWQRNFDRFNASLKAPDGSLRFDGPFVRPREWVAASKRIGCDYHVFEAKWHDGICWWDTRHTAWKTPFDACREFSDASRQAGIRHGYYYSAVFDHNPDFDEIQPLRRSTSSFLGMRGGKRAALRKSLGFSQFIRLVFAGMERHARKAGVQIEEPYPFFDEFQLNEFTYDPERYERYVLGQLDELCSSYGAQILWTDWFGAHGEALSEPIMDFMAAKHPRVIVTFNASILGEPRWAHYLSWEAHGLRDTWRQVNAWRSLARPWELVTPAATNWDVPQPKTDPLENAVTAALIMASGGKVNFGVAAEMDGSLNPTVMDGLEALGRWYAPRRPLFVDAVPMRYPKASVPGLKLRGEDLVAVAACLGADRLIHVLDLHPGARARSHRILLELRGPAWDGLACVVAEPSGRSLAMNWRDDSISIEVPPELVDPVDTILRLRRRGKESGPEGPSAICDRASATGR